MIQFVTGIDTGVGKTLAVGRLAGDMAEQGLSVITQKLVQTGSSEPAEDIVTHRQIMGIELTEEDNAGLTCPYVLPKAASPHLAAHIAGITIEPDRITEATKKLAARYDNVIIEGAGGLMVPLNRSMTILDYLEKMQYPTILVTSSRLGSINHTLMSIELLLSRGIPLVSLIYNRFCEMDREVGDDTLSFFREKLKRLPNTPSITEMS